ncbi:oligopeptidase A [Aestuariirhabdus litorea]|uniref:oligopeptidase A n=1 Tax=Aestuariirhabdus litorea TaxID=2528527 RepID=A0A3P3VP28_9GAMM|nr:oligopeptidase A [Aestuariirhabdus litorea]RRJ82573.1 oligopeptidase A [Aestuariirhabdus litorea]RWW92732.1 oligopeptidase A [Endozoicomonadaceae bacterium GTF-13]
MSNPLLQSHTLPPFDRIEAHHAEPAIRQLLEESRSAINALLQNNPEPDWTNLVAPLESIDDRLGQAWSPVSHMNSVVNSPELREAYNACLPLLSEYSTEMGQNRALYEAYYNLSQRADFGALDGAQQKVINNALRDFRLSGIALEPAKQKRYGELKKRLSELTSKFSENVLDATQAWSKQVDSAEALAGMPESALQAAAQAAKAKGFDGYLLNLEFPSYLPVMTYCDNRELRKEVYTAYATRASEQGPHAGQWDNSELINEILALRHELAELLEFKDYAELSLATKMAQHPQQVIDFLRDLAGRTRPVAQQELEALRAFAREHHGQSELEAWDISYYSEKLKQHTYSISQEELRPYFPAEQVIAGMFEVVKRLYGIEIRQQQGVATWHGDVRFYEVSDESGVVGHFYLDPYARENKRGGAWMDECRVRRRLESGELQRPVAYLVCNFNGPVGDKPALLTHDEVTTLFHEFGHGLHHLLTRIDYAPVAGINGVPWDAVELPSQFMENWCWETEGLALISGHYETGQPLPAEMLEKLLAARNFQQGLMMVRQLEFSLFDFLIHHQYQPGLDVQQVIDQVRAEVAVIVPPAFNRFQHSFSHIFAGGYAAGYYSYKWAEVLSADAFSRFEEEGIFNPETGRSFLREILQQGGSAEPMELFKRFRGREPSVDALLRHSGIVG